MLIPCFPFRFDYHFDLQERPDSYSKWNAFLNKTFGTEGQSYSNEWTDAAKKLFNVLNDHLRFPDSPEISKPTRKRRHDAAFRREYAAHRAANEAPQQQQPMGAETINDAMGALAPAGSPLPNNNDSTAADGGNVRSPAGRSLRIVTQSRSLQDTVHPDTIDIHALGAAPSHRATDYSIHHFFDPFGRSLYEKFPDFEERIPLLRSQPEIQERLLHVLMFHTRILAADRNITNQELQQLETKLKELEKFLRNLRQFTALAFSSLEDLLSTIERITTTQAAPQPTANQVQNEEPSVSVETAPMQPDENSDSQRNTLIRLQGPGYMGNTIQVCRIDVRVGSSIKLRGSTNSFLPVGTYFFKNDLMVLCGMQFSANDADYKKWTNYVRLFFFALLVLLLF